MQTKYFRTRGKSAGLDALLFCACILLFILGGASASAQIAGTGSIQGTVSDPSGAVVPQATVTVTDDATQVKRSTKTSSAGVYLFPGLHIGTYDLSVAATGFKTYVQKGIVLEVGSSIAVNPTLSIGAAAQQVEVQAEGLALQTEDPTYKQTIDQNEMTAMPLNGRHMTDLIFLSGGTTPAPSGDFTGSKYSYQTISLSIAGGAGNTTLWRLDGGDNQDYMGNGNLPYPFPDAVSQFSVESSALGAQDGGHVGGMVNVVTRSGTNSFHGSAFEFIRNNYIDATNFFSSTPDQLHRDQFGGTFGGPIIRNKVFGFAGYQRTRQTESQSSKQVTVPTAANLAGDWSSSDGDPTNTSVSYPCTSNGKPLQLLDPLTGDTLTGNKYSSAPTYDAAALALEQKYFPKIDPALDPNGCGYVFYSIPNDFYTNQFVTRVDWTVGPKQNFYGRYYINGYQLPAYFFPNNIFVTTQSGNIERVQSIVLGDAYTFTPHLVNSIHLTLDRRTNERGYNTSDINANTLGVTDYQMSKAGLQISGGKWNIGGGTNSLSHFNDNAINLSDDITWVHGRHTVMFGGQWVHNQLNIGNIYEGNGHFSFDGTYSGSGPGGGTKKGDANLDFLAGTMSGFEQSKQQQNALRGTFPSLYIQDTYHANPKLTMEGGLRWGPNLMPVDYFNRGLEFNQADFVGNVHSGVYPTAPAGILYYGDKGVTRQFTQNSWWQFSPNLGISFDPTGSGKTVIRAGGELAYDNPNFFTAQRNQQNPPYATAIANAQTSSSGPMVFSSPWSTGAVTSDPFPQPQVPTAAQAQFFPNSQYIFMQPQFHPAYTIQWTLSLQHEFGRGWQGQLDYIGNATRHNPYGVGISPAVFIPGQWGAGGTGCTGIVTTGPSAVTPGKAGSDCSTTSNAISRYALTMENPDQGALINGGGSSTLVRGDTNASYNGLVTTVQHRLSSTFSLMANWTWSKCLNINDASGDYAGSTTEDVYNPRLDWGPCGADYRNIENLSLVLRSDFHGMNHFARSVINHWELAPLMRVRSGAPVNVTSGSDISLDGIGGDRPNLVPGVDPYHEVTFRKTKSEATREYLNPGAFAYVCPGNKTTGCAAAGTFGNISRNAFRAPSYFDVDAQISRQFPVYERLALDLRLEAFNTLNHPSFGGPDANLSHLNSTFGQVSSASGARIFQGAIKLSF
ncbi:MAG TPA: carboxypeptidase-like regulatory domain-containing protein [Terracidiphilus sp.]|nr:carboxypeptidase-like regulatory domain-containing protein [Terracidiphilus sp.]